LSIVTDHLGVPTTLVDERGREVWAAELDIYGEVREIEGSRHACPFRFAGQYEDAETGLYYNRFRYYDPRAGLYISRDPLGFEGGINPFAYVADPLVSVDPLGLFNKYRRKNGQFGSKPGPDPKPKPSAHGNSANSTKPAVVYAQYDDQGNFQKWGITQEVKDPKKRYPKLPKDWDVDPKTKGSRKNMLALERELVEKDPGPLNKEPWAGKKKGQPLSPRAAAICAKK
jgi:RHS repeat-associated protein